MKKICTVCGKEFESKRGPGKTCSPECRNIREKAVEKRCRALKKDLKAAKKIAEVRALMDGDPGAPKAKIEQKMLPIGTEKKESFWVIRLNLSFPVTVSATDEEDAMRKAADVFADHWRDVITDPMDIPHEVVIVTVKA